MKLVVVIAMATAATVATVVWRSRHGAEVWHSVDHPA
jgi:hypothetical protein